ncbi:MAG: flagellar basal-body MS-ring/collar protein FliF [Christensenellales bacterium]|jgi:flagellar M-ring protein FliF
MAAAEKKSFSPRKLIDGFKNIEKGKKIRIIVLSVLTIAVIAALAIFLNQTTYTVLYSGMDPTDTGKVLTALNEMGVDAKTQGEDTVLVPAERADEIRLELAAQGYPTSGVNDYSIYGSASGIGTTSAEKQVYYKYQLQSNLRSTILKMDKIADAVVNLDLGEDSTFVLSENKRPATASIMLTLREGEILTRSEAKAIRELVAKSISGLDADNIRIVDSKMQLYTEEDEYGATSVDARLQLQDKVRDQLSQQIINLLGPVFGEENVLASVSVKLNFDEKSMQSVEYAAPEGKEEGIVVSMRELVEAIASNADGTTPAGIDANGNASQYLEIIENSENAIYYNVSREVNYEVNQTATQIREAQGEIESLTVAVIINRTDTGSYINEVKNLVASAIGADPRNITVSGMAFGGLEAEREQKSQEAEAALALQREKEEADRYMEMIRMIIIAGGGFLVLLFLLLIIMAFRPKKEKKKKRRRKKGEVESVDVLVGTEELPVPPPAKEQEEDALPELTVGGKDNNLRAVEEFIFGNPESAANLLRNWLNEE